MSHDFDTCARAVVTPGSEFTARENSQPPSAALALLEGWTR